MVAVANAAQGVAVFNNGTFGTNTNNIIGVPGAGNVISGNGNFGILIRDPETTGTLVQGNKIGTNALGTAAIPNVNAGVGINVTSSNNTIGGTGGGHGQRHRLQQLGEQSELGRHRLRRGHGQRDRRQLDLFEHWPRHRLERGRDHAKRRQRERRRPRREWPHELPELRPAHRDRRHDRGNVRARPGGGLLPDRILQESFRGRPERLRRRPGVRERDDREPPGRPADL